MKKVIFMLIAFFSLNINALAYDLQCNYNAKAIDGSVYIKYRITYYANGTIKREIARNSEEVLSESNNNTHTNVTLFFSNNENGSLPTVGDNFNETNMKSYYDKKVCPYIAFHYENTNYYIEPVKDTSLHDPSGAYIWVSKATTTINYSNGESKTEETTNKSDAGESSQTIEEVTDEKSDTIESGEGQYYFCKDNVLAIFRALGWIIIIIKILVPVLLIIFGTIDFAKAVIASKDDEIKKATKSLVLRTISGVIIFFVPTIISFIISVIGGEDIFNKNSNRNDSSQFGACTYCLFNPKDDTCKTIKN